MALLDYKCLGGPCNLQMASSVIALYTSVAYIIAFFIEIWWIWETGGEVSYLGYILTVAYLVSFLLSTILVTGISNRRISYLAVWMSGLLAMVLPEAGLALFMSLQFWRLNTVYGLTELTCWACRLTVNMVGLICVQSLYTLWREEKQVLSSLRDLNMAPVSLGGTMERSRRGSVSSVSTLGRSTSKNNLNNGLQPHPPPPSSPRHPPQPDNRPQFHRWGSVTSVGSHRSLPTTLPSSAAERSQFNASMFDNNLRYSLRKVPNSAGSKSMNNVSTQDTQSLIQPHQHQLLFRSNSVSYFPSWAQNRLNNGYFNGSRGGGFLVDESGRVVYLEGGGGGGALQQHMANPPSRTSLAESDETHKYRDVAL